jgi:hypothetical protein
VGRAGALSFEQSFARLQSQNFYEISNPREADQCPLSGVKQTLLRHVAMSANDLKRTFGGVHALLLAAVTLGLFGLILIAADATEREHREW